MKRKHKTLLKKLEKVKTGDFSFVIMFYRLVKFITTYDFFFVAAGPDKKPATVKTHLRDMVIIPEMIGSVVAVSTFALFNPFFLFITYLYSILLTPFLSLLLCFLYRQVYNGKVFNLVDIKCDMVGYYLGEFSISYRCVFN